MTIVAVNPVSSSWVFSTDSSTNPCRCCDAPRAMDHMDGYWHCDMQNRIWVVLDSAFDESAAHSCDQCLGSCRQHSLMDSMMFTMIHSEAFGLCWGDLILADELAALALETPEQRAARLAAEELMKEERFKATRATDMERYARLKAQTNTEMVKTSHGKKVAVIRKIQEPCKWLYLDEKAPKFEWQTTRDGKREPPHRPHLTGAECWAYEYHDPKTGKLQVKHTCDRLHPGEEGWMTEWNTNGRWRPAAAETRDFGCLRDRTFPCSHSDSSSTVSAVSSRSFHSNSSAPPRTHYPQQPSRPYKGSKKAGRGFSSLAFDDSD